MASGCPRMAAYSSRKASHHASGLSLREALSLDAAACSILSGLADLEEVPSLRASEEEEDERCSCWVPLAATDDRWPSPLPALSESIVASQGDGSTGPRVAELSGAQVDALKGSQGGGLNGPYVDGRPKAGDAQ